MFITAMSLMTNEITCQCLKQTSMSAWSARIFRRLSTMNKSPALKVNSMVQRSLPYAIRQRVHVRLECRLDDVTCLWEEGTVRRVERVITVITFMFVQLWIQ
jgi:hypothetical protein